MKRFALLFCVALSPAVAAAAELDEALQGFDEPAATAPLEDVLSGFDEPAPSRKPAEAATPRRWRLGGDALLSTSYNYERPAPAAGATDYRGLSRLRARLNLRLDGDLAAGWDTRVSGYAWHDFVYGLHGRDGYPAAVRDELEDEAELQEAWLRGKLTEGLDLKVGRQIVVWGKSDNLRVTDVLNPLDTREPGLTDIEDLRQPLFMTRLDAYRGTWNLSAIAVHESRSDKRPVFGAEFYPFAVPQPAEVLPADGGADTEYALALNGLFSGWDLALYGASLFDDRPHLEDGALRHSRIGMLGAAVNVAAGNWLWKGEAAHFSGLRYSSLPGREKARSDLLLGVEYSGLADATVSLEIVDRHLHEWEAALAAEAVVEDDVQWALRYTGEFLHARLKLTALTTQSGHRWQRGGFTRLQASYELAQATILSAGVVLYKPGAALPFNAIGDNDRIFAELKYSF